MSSDTPTPAAPDGISLTQLLNGLRGNGAPAAPQADGRGGEAERGTPMPSSIPALPGSVAALYGIGPALAIGAAGSQPGAAVGAAAEGLASVSRAGSVLSEYGSLLPEIEVTPFAARVASIGVRIGNILPRGLAGPFARAWSSAWTGGGRFIAALPEAAGPAGIVIAVGTILYFTMGEGRPHEQGPALQEGTRWNPASSGPTPTGPIAGGAFELLEVENAAQLAAAINRVNSQPGNYAILFTRDIQLTAELPPLHQPAGFIFIEGAGHILDAAGHRGFVVDGTAATLSDMTIENAVAHGGAGGRGLTGGGGGAGLGGGLLAVNHASVALSNVTFEKDRAEGGAGGAGYTAGDDGYGGGGGMAGKGGDGAEWQSSFGGFLGRFTDGFTDLERHGPSGGGGGLGGATKGSNGGANGDAGNGGGLSPQGTQGGWGGGGGGASGDTHTGDMVYGGAGGYGGGGGGGKTGGEGGFGGGGGGGSMGQGAAGGFGGGHGARIGGILDKNRGAGGGGGGLGAGGAIFSDATSSISIQGGSVAGGTATGGAAGGVGASAGKAYGDAIFLAGNQVMPVRAAAGETTTLDGQIADQSGSHDSSGRSGFGALLAEGGGTVVLAGPGNAYSGGTYISQGTTLEIATRGAAGEGAVVFADGGTGLLRIDEAALNEKGHFGNGIRGMQLHDRIDFAGLAGAKEVTIGKPGAMTTEDGHAATLVTISNGTASAAVMIEGLNEAARFVLADDGQGGTILQMAQAMEAPSALTETTGPGGRPVYSGTAQAGSTVTLYQVQADRGTLLQLGTTSAGEDGGFSFAGGTPPDPGAGVIVAVARDASGNLSALSAPLAGPEGTPPPPPTDHSQPALGSIVVRVASEEQLVAAIRQANAGTSPAPLAIVFTANITLSGGDLPVLDAPAVTILGQGHTLDGHGQHRGLLVFSGNVAIADLTIAHTLARGGSGGLGGSGGGGGAGLGGGLFVSANASVLAENVHFLDDTAKGGNGGATRSDFGGAYGGGGGLGGDGGYAGDDWSRGTSNWKSLTRFSGGGGGVGNLAMGGWGGMEGLSGTVENAPSDQDGTGSRGSVKGGGGDGGSYDAHDKSGGGGGIHGLTGKDNRNGGWGSTGGWGGGGGGNSTFGGDGGFGGGGGGGEINGGHGGWGGGGGGGTPARHDEGAPGGFGGGAGGSGTSHIEKKGGGGGLGAGGAVFVQQGGRLTLINSRSEGSTVKAGSGQNGGGDGKAYGAGMFLQGDQAVTFGAVAGHTTRISDAIADEAGSHDASGLSGHGQVVTVGDGTVVLAGAGSTYTGGTIVTGGTLEVAAQGAAGSGAITFAGKATLKLDAEAFDAEGRFGNLITGLDTGDAVDLVGFGPAESVTLSAGADGHTTVQVTGTAGTVSLTLAEAPQGELVATDDGQGGTLLKLAALQQAAAGMSAFDPVAPAAPAANTAGGAMPTELEPNFAAPLQVQDPQAGLPGLVSHEHRSTP